MKSPIALATLLVATSSCAALLGTDIDDLRPKDERGANGPNGATAPDADAALDDSLDGPGQGDAGDGGPEFDPVGEADRRYAQWPVPVTSPPPSSYDVTAETIRDKVTGLMWARAVSATGQDWPSAMSSCANLTYAGRHDWRLPTRIELLSIVDYAVTSGSMMAAVGFDGAAAVPEATTYWTASKLPGPSDTTSRFAVDFSNAKLMTMLASQSALVRCVRGGAIGRAPRWVAGSGTAKDTFTGLEWRTTAVVFPVPSRTAMGTLDEAKKSCADVAIDGGGFRVPTTRELHTLYDEQASADNALDARFPWTTTGPTLWSATLDSAQPTRAHAFDFHYSVTLIRDTTENWYAALCVR